MRYRDMEAIDLGAARRAVCAWLDENQGGTLAQMAEDLKRRYPAHPDEMAVILRGMMAAELCRRTRPQSGSDWRSVLVSGDRARMRAVTGRLSPWGSAVTRLHRFQGEYPDVQFTSPVMRSVRLHWLPSWLPEIYLLSLTFEWAKIASMR